MKKLTSIFIQWLPMAAAIVCLYGIMYIAIQQSIRMAANEAPRQYAIDMKTKLESGIPIADALKTIAPTDMRSSLAPFVLICDGSGLAIYGTATLGGKYPSPPQGVCAATGAGGESSITWQPERHVRNAIVVIPYSLNGHEGYIIGGQSLKGAEERERFLGIQIAAGIIITLFATFVVSLLVHFMRNRINSSLYPQT